MNQNVTAYIYARALTECLAVFLFFFFYIIIKTRFRFIVIIYDL